MYACELTKRENTILLILELQTLKSLLEHTLGHRPIVASFSLSTSKAFLACSSLSFMDNNFMHRLSFGTSYRINVFEFVKTLQKQLKV